MILIAKKTSSSSLTPRRVFSKTRKNSAKTTQNLFSYFLGHQCRCEEFSCLLSMKTFLRRYGSCGYFSFSLTADLSTFFLLDPHRETSSYATGRIKPGLHEPQLQVERSVKFVFSIVVERRRCALQVSKRIQENKET